VVCKYNQAVIWGGGSPEFVASDRLSFAHARVTIPHPDPRR